MQYLFFPIFFLCSLFILYLISKNDFLFVRKGLTPSNIFDNFFLSFLGFFVLGRLLYIISSLRFDLLNPIPFLHVIRYPGMLYLGGVLGFMGISFFFVRSKKIASHLFDVYSLSLFPVFLFILFFSNNSGNFLFFNMGILILALMFFVFGIYSYKNSTLKDGSIFLLFFCLIAVFTLIQGFTSGGRILFNTFSIAQGVGILAFGVSAILVLINESIIGNKKR